MIDVKLFVALIALCISLYSLRASRKIAMLEKRTMVLAEVSELQLLVQEMTEMHNGLLSESISGFSTARVSAAGALDLTQRGVFAVKKTYESLEQKKSLSVAELEKLRPPVQAIIIELKKELKTVNDLFGRSGVAA